MPISPTPPSGRNTNSSWFAILFFYPLSKKDIACGDRHDPACTGVEHQQATIIYPCELAGNRPVRQVYRYLFAYAASDIAPPCRNLAYAPALVPRGDRFRHRGIKM